MIQPYEGKSAEDRGMLLLDGEELYEQGRAAVKGGLSLAIHAIGDRANHEVLQAFTQLREYEQTLPEAGLSSERPLRHRIEHVQLLHPDDTQRLVQLGVIASMQPIHAISDMGMADRYLGSAHGPFVCLADPAYGRGQAGIRFGRAGGVAQPLLGAACRGNPPAS